jgi:hypothetical protein
MTLSIERSMQKHGNHETIIKWDPEGHLSRGTSLVETCGYMVSVWPTDLLATITPVLTKSGPELGCHINVPQKYWVGHALDTLIDKLHERGKLPTYMGLDPLLDAFINEKFKEGAPS